MWCGEIDEVQNILTNASLVRKMDILNLSMASNNIRFHRKLLKCLEFDIKRYTHCIWIQNMTIFIRANIFGTDTSVNKEFISFP